MSDQILKSNEELFHLAGDPERGVVGTHDFTGNATAKNVLVRFGDLVLHCDVYPDMGEGHMVHLICPRCCKALKISGKNKQISYDTQRKLLSVEPFQCTWEMGDVVGSYTTLCNLKIGIHNNIARKA